MTQLAPIPTPKRSEPLEICSDLEGPSSTLPPPPQDPPDDDEPPPFISSSEMWYHISVPLMFTWGVV